MDLEACCLIWDETVHHLRFKIQDVLFAMIWTAETNLKSVYQFSITAYIVTAEQNQKKNRSAK